MKIMRWLRCFKKKNTIQVQLHQVWVGFGHERSGLGTTLLGSGTMLLGTILGQT